MESIVIRGGRPLHGVVRISGSKNASLPLMVCSLLTSQKLVLEGVPALTDIRTMSQLLITHGVSIITQETRDSRIITMHAADVDNFIAPYEIVKKMRASIWVLAPLLAKFGYARVSMPGGCAIGVRQVDMHINVLSAMGADISIDQGFIVGKSQGPLRGTTFHFDKLSVGATITGIFGGVLAEGETFLTNCAIEPEIVDVCQCLSKMGAIIEGIGSSAIKIIGVRELHGAQHCAIPDRIEAGTYMIAAAITGGNMRIVGAEHEQLTSVIAKLRECGVNVEVDEDKSISVYRNGDIISTNLQTAPYPGYPTDLQAQFMALMSVGNDVSVITENIFENRFMHAMELGRLGADISIYSNTAVVKGKKELRGADVMASDLRASVSLILAGLVAQGETKVRRIYHLDRGYENLEYKMRACGADIERVIGEA